MQGDVSDLAEQLVEEQQRAAELEASLDARRADLEEEANLRWQQEVASGEGAQRLALLQEEHAATQRLWAHRAQLCGLAGSAAAAGGQAEQAAISALVVEEASERWSVAASATTTMVELLAALHWEGLEVAAEEAEQRQQQELAMGAPEEAGEVPPAAALAAGGEEVEGQLARALEQLGQTERQLALGGMETAEASRRLAMVDAEQASRQELWRWLQQAAMGQLAALAGEVQGWTLEAEGASAVYHRDAEEVMRSVEATIVQERQRWQVVVAELTGRLHVSEQEESERILALWTCRPIAAEEPRATAEQPQRWAVMQMELRQREAERTATTRGCSF